MKSNSPASSLFLALTGLAACGSPDVTLDDGDYSSEMAIIDGSPADASRYESIGGLVTIAPDGTLSLLCSASLAFPRVVVTAKHCMLVTPPAVPMAFAIGVNALAPERLVPVVARVWERTVTAGIMALGSDVAVGILAEPVRDVPLVLNVPISERFIGSTFEAVGYGRDEKGGIGTRLSTPLTLTAAGPKPYWQAVYLNDFDAFLQDFGTILPLDLALRVWNNELIADHYDAVLRRQSGIPSGGDSGGPLLKRVLGQWFSFGVASGVKFFGGDTDRTVQSNNIVYSAFGPEATHLIYSAPICNGISEEGTCVDKTITRCSSRDEGFPHVIHTPCVDTCVETPAGAQCAPSCASNTDCTAIARNGVCTAGTCTWSAAAKCSGEGAFVACFLCCLGQAGGNPTCFGGCPRPPPPGGTASASTSVSLPGLPEISLPTE